MRHITEVLAVHAVAELPILEAASSGRRIVNPEVIHLDKSSRGRHGLPAQPVKSSKFSSPDINARLLSRVEAHFDLGPHLDGVAFLD
jgi:hypothetical protein